MKLPFLPYLELWNSNFCKVPGTVRGIELRTERNAQFLMTSLISAGHEAVISAITACVRVFGVRQWRKEFCPGKQSIRGRPPRTKTGSLIKPVIFSSSTTPLDEMDGKTVFASWLICCMVRGKTKSTCKISSQQVSNAICYNSDHEDLIAMGNHDDRVLVRRKWKRN